MPSYVYVPMRPLLLLVLAATAYGADINMSVDQLRSFILSSKRLGHTDRQIGDYLKSVKLTERLEAGAVEDLQASGVSGRTLDALWRLSEASRSLSAPKPAPVKAPPPVIPPPDSIEQKRVLQAATEYARSYSRNLPNFICTQVTRRYYDPSGLEFWQQMDVVTSKLSFFEQKEDYKVVLVNSQYVNTDMDRLGGTTTRGEFGTRLAEIFDAWSRTEFDWERWATLRGKRMHVFSYRVPQERSKFTVNFENRNMITAGYKGLIYVDRDSLTIMRVTQEAETPTTFPIQGIRVILDYDITKISDQEFILPLRAVNFSRTGKTLFKNEIEFRMYNKFGVESTITFTPDPLSDDQISEKPAAEATPSKSSP